MRKSAKNLLTGKTADVTLTRGGLTVSVEGVPAVDAAQAAQALLRAFRGLVEAGYDELREVGPTYHAGGTDQPEDADIETVTMPPEGRLTQRVVGFSVP